MKAHADHMAPLGGAIFEGGGKTFINKGTNRRWLDTLTAGAVELVPALRPQPAELRAQYLPREA